MAKRKNYGFEKRQKEIKRQKKLEEKRARRLQKKDGDSTEAGAEGLVDEDVEDLDDDSDDEDEETGEMKREAIRMERRSHDAD